MTSTNVTSDAQRLPTIPQANGHTTGDHDLTSDNELDLRDQHKSRTSTEIEKEGFSDSDVIQPSCDDDVTDKCDGCDVKRTNGEGGAAEEEEEEEEERGGCCCGMRRRREKREKTSVGLFGLFRYAEPVDVVMMAVGTLAAMVTGCIQPLSFVLCGEIINTFIANFRLLMTCVFLKTVSDDRCSPFCGPQVFATPLLGSLVLGRAFPSLQAFSTARAVAGHVFDVINLRPHIDVTSTLVRTIAPLTGIIEFRDVHFRYPSGCSGE
ncbi:hypothetical protein ACOMHN_034802 [Nucella lapillus]